MSDRLLISALPGEARAAWLCDGRLDDLLILRDDKPSRLGDLYLGRITRIERGLDAAFVDLGLARPGLLPRSEAPKGGLGEGQAIVVRVVREAADDKGPRVTARLTDVPDGLEILVRESKAPALLLRGADPLVRALTARRPPDAIVIDDGAYFQEARTRLAKLGSGLAERLRLDRDAGDLFEREGIEAAIDGLLQPRVDLPSGGRLLIEPVSSLTAIDVDSAGYSGTGDAEHQARALDLEAAAEIPRQLRLRALSGLIVIDFLALRAKRDREEVVAALKSGLAADPEPTRVFPMASSGLIEMTRRRGRPALHEILTEPLGIAGSGRDKDAVTLAFEALRALRQASMRSPGASPGLHVSAPVAAALEGPAGAARAHLEERLGRPIAVQVAPAASQPDFEIVLGSAP